MPILLFVLLVAVFTASYDIAMAWDANSPYHGWADKQLVMPAARSRFLCSPQATCSCCDGAEIVKTKFRVASNARDAWDWLNPITNKWERVPDDIIHWDEPTPDKQGVAFEYPVGSGILRCFFPPQDGGG